MIVVVSGPAATSPSPTFVLSIHGVSGFVGFVALALRNYQRQTKYCAWLD